MIIPANKNNTYKMLIVLDKELIEAENICTYNELVNKIDTVMRDEKMFLDSSNWYINGNIEICLSLIHAFCKTNWFMHYIKEWKIKDILDNEIEDILAVHPPI